MTMIRRRSLRLEHQDTAHAEVLAENNERKSIGSATPVGTMASLRGLTSTLMFAVISVGLGSSFTMGYNLGSTNVPQTVMVHWIRDTRCSNRHRYKQYNRTLNISTDLWCKPVHGKELEELFNSFADLNWMWTGVSVVYFAGAMFGAAISRRLVGKFGRKGALLANNVPGVLGAVLAALSYPLESYFLLIAGRTILGIHAGVTGVVATTYFMDLVPLNLRGAFGSVQATGECVGILAAQILGLPQILGGTKTWPYLLGVSAIPCILQFITLPFYPESPHYLFVIQDDKQAAINALRKLRRFSNFGLELLDMQNERRRGQNEITIDFFGLFLDPKLRKVAVVGLVATSSLEMTGLNIALLYSTFIFMTAGTTELTAMYGTIGLGGLLLLATSITATGFVERIGRRPLLLFGLAGMAVSLIFLTIFVTIYESRHSITEEIAESSSPDSWLPFAAMVSLCVYLVMHSIGPGTVTSFLIAEMFSSNARDAATSGAVAGQWVSAIVVVVVFPLIQEGIGGYTFLIFVGFLLFYYVFTYITLPETMGKEPEKVQFEIESQCLSDWFQGFSPKSASHQNSAQQAPVISVIVTPPDNESEC